MSLPVWRERSPEEAHHFNPAFCGALIYEFVRSFAKAKTATPSFALPFCALPIALHPATRDRLPRSTRTALYPWLEQNPDVLVGYADRVRNLTPYIREAMLYVAARQAIIFNDGGTIAIGKKRASFPGSFLSETTPETRETVEAVRRVARWFAGAGETTTILAAWGIRV